MQIEMKNGKFPGLKEMVSHPGRPGYHYSWGWSATHYCVKNPKYAKKFQKFVKALVSGRGVKRTAGYGTRKTVKGDEVWRVFKKSMGLKNDAAVKAFEESWHRYVENDLKLETGSGLTKAALAAIRDQRPIRAKRLFQEAIDAGSCPAITYHQYAKLLNRDGQNGPAIKLWRKAIELDPLEAEYYASLADALREDGSSDEAKKLLALAQELDPDSRRIEVLIKELD